MISKLSDATIENRLLWALSAWKVYVQEIFSHISQASTSSFYTTLGNQVENPDTAYTLQSYDGDSILGVLSYLHRCAYSLHLLCNYCSSVVLPTIC